MGVLRQKPSMPRFSRLKHHTSAARRLRRNPTKAEQLLWTRLRAGQIGPAFRRQHPVAGFILDFYAPAVKLAVELDGSQHAGSLRDETRTAALSSKGISVLRFWNTEVAQNPEGVLTAIQSVCAVLAPETPSLSLPLLGGENASANVALQDLRLTLAMRLR